ncbi:sensor histidine kinase [Micromonospora sp. CPCC 206061]|uniref:sensor histidine kinase n=1 Tax=Micromonospora sp. CPCC 206061 TaxID=3122410 RepID=UPI002FF28589
MGSILRTAWHGLRRTLAGPDYSPIRVGPRWRRLAGLGVALVVALGIITAQYLNDDRRLPMAAAVVIAALAVLPLLLLLSRPLVAWRLMIVAQLFGAFNSGLYDGWPWAPSQIVISLVVVLVVAARVDGQVAVWMGVITLIPVWIFVQPSNQAGVALLYTVVVVVGDLIGRNARIKRALTEQSEVSELEKARRAVLEERARIARELHDVVAHHMSMIAVQAETAPYRLGDLPDPVRDEFSGIAGAARGALTEMRRLLGVLRSDAAEPLKAPQPGLTDLPELVATARRAGVEIELDAAGGPEPPEPVGLAAYRIVQEALANATRHAPGAPVRVEIRPWSRQLLIRVHNGPSAQPATDATSEGHGLTGMRERAVLLGGEFEAAPTAEGGFEVDARLPYDQT